MIRKPSRAAARVKRHYRIRNHVNGTAQRPRLAVFRSNKHMYAQIIDDVTHHTLVAASTMESEIASKVEFTSTVAAAAVVGEVLAKRAVEKGITEVVFDRGGFIYHGKVKALADAAREAGLNF
ncbi:MULTISPECIES: 50S ribosomal protein L18 [Anaerotignum]|uniref:Large ribosomal subunit protein uL18 n=1 Tax=Anaerotignum propionicum DSM 1682 TaxID=991789 RepID=A0A0X8VCA6_ANAPI|nr:MULTISPECIES: 50S ribosomal protein L18 [Anaerotignum]AMJ40157.1 50S ribosomal protein L18 [Anaerotignum propionicum DSM 1682]MCQ4934823.1 50S ribosomal protein L18 [Anaerotignum propionicum]SHF13807.1 large subunit ribosomal protein L18 [[Clostridium] propionicum DSM 1682] [Anaerotignum propionicum DSM 1682]HBF65252.1 50S ribosomal protein L18 [Clostridium sp.]